MPDNKHIDIDPYGEEIWEDDDGYNRHYMSESGIYTKTISVKDHCISSTLKRSQIEDIKAATGIDVVAKLEKMLVDELTKMLVDELTKEISKEMANKIHHWASRDIDTYLNEQKEIKRIYSELDPYGEENWEE